MHTPRIAELTDTDIQKLVTDDFSQCGVDVRSDLAEAHALYLTRLCRPGTWWTGAERLAIAAETRAAENCEFCEERKTALSPYTIEGTHNRAEGSDILPDSIVDLVHLVVSDVTRVTKAAIDRLSQSGLTPQHYVEALGVAVAVRSIDMTCRGLGAPRHALPDAQPGEPSKALPEGLIEGEAFVPWLGTEQPAPPNDDLWPSSPPNVARALSSVPDAVRDWFLLSEAQYIAMKNFRVFDAGRSLSRPQIELLAGRVSALNDCFY